MSKALPKGSVALCYVQGYEHPAFRRDRLQELGGEKMQFVRILLVLASAAMPVEEDQSDPIRDLATFADTSGSQYVRELRCDTPRHWFIRAEVRQFVAKFIKAERVDEFMTRTFDRRVGHSVIHDPCDQSELADYRRWASNQMIEALAAFKKTKTYKK